MLPSLRRAVAGLEPALDTRTELTGADRIQDPDPSRILDVLERGSSMQPSQDLASPPHVVVGAFQARFLALYDRRTELVWDTAPNRALRHVLQSAARHLAAIGTPDSLELRAHFTSLAATEGLQQVGRMRTTDLLHRSLRAARYRCVLRLHRMLSVRD
jgi:hypothetical protein